MLIWNKAELISFGAGASEEALLGSVDEQKGLLFLLERNVIMNRCLVMKGYQKK